MTHATPGRPQASYTRLLQTFDPRRERGRHGRDRTALRPVLTAVAMGFVGAIAVVTSVPTLAVTDAQGEARQSVYAIADRQPQTIETQELAVAADVVIPAMPAEGYEAVAPPPAIHSQVAGLGDVSLIQSERIVNPVDMSRISGGFGPREAPCAGCSTFHDGADITPGNGAPIVSIADGVVVTAEENNGGLGVHVEVQHNVGAQVVTSSYGHMQYGSIAVSVGQQVTAGQLIGLVGSTGQSTGPHLHLEMYYADGVRFDALPWLAEHVNA